MKKILTAGILLFVGAANADIINDADVFTNALVTDATQTVVNLDTFSPANLFDGQDSYSNNGIEDGAFIATHSTNTAFVNFTTSRLVDLAGITILARHDGSSRANARSFESIRFFIDSNLDGIYETKLVDFDVDPSYDINLSYNNSIRPNTLLTTFTFNTLVVGSNFRLEVDKNAAQTAGSRLVELDAIGEFHDVSLNVGVASTLVFLGMFISVTFRRRRNQ